MSLSTSDKVRENKLRRGAERRGYMLVKSHRRDPQAVDFGKYILVPSTWSNPAPRYGGEQATLAFERGEGVTMDEMEAALHLPLGEMEKFLFTAQVMRRHTDNPIHTS